MLFHLPLLSPLSPIAPYRLLWDVLLTFGRIDGVDTVIGQAGLDACVHRADDEFVRGVFVGANADGLLWIVGGGLREEPLQVRQRAKLAIDEVLPVTADVDKELKRAGGDRLGFAGLWAA